MNSAVATRPDVHVDYPQDWFYANKCVPDLGVPRELFAISNRPIAITPPGSGQPRPMVGSLDRGAMFIWCYYVLPGDPDPNNPDGDPGYCNQSLPLRYLSTEAFPSADAREWNRGDFIWRRIGFTKGDAWITVFIWEGIGVEMNTIDDATKILASIA